MLTRNLCAHGELANFASTVLDCNVVSILLSPVKKSQAYGICLYLPDLLIDNQVLCTGLDLAGTPVAVFGLGDSVSYADNFAGGLAQQTGLVATPKSV